MKKANSFIQSELIEYGMKVSPINTITKSSCYNDVTRNAHIAFNIRPKYEVPDTRQNDNHHDGTQYNNTQHVNTLLNNTINKLMKHNDDITKDTKKHLA